MKIGGPITKSILIADLPAGDKPWSCRPTMTAVCRLIQAYYHVSNHSYCNNSYVLRLS